MVVEIIMDSKIQLSPKAHVRQITAMNKYVGKKIILYYKSINIHIAVWRHLQVLLYDSCYLKSLI